VSKRLRCRAFQKEVSEILQLMTADVAKRILLLLYLHRKDCDVAVKSG